MSAVTRFLFDRSFDPPDAPGALRSEPRAPTFSQADLDAAAAVAFARGREAGLADALAEAARCSSRALDAVVAQLGRIGGEAEARHRTTLRDVGATLRLAIEKALPATAARSAPAEIEALLHDCLRRLEGEPRVVVRVRDELLDDVRASLARAAAGTAFEGRTVLLADDSLGPGEARIEWADGGVELSPGRIASEIAAAIEQALAPASAG